METTVKKTIKKTTVKKTGNYCKKENNLFLKHYEHVFLKKSLPFVNLVFNIWIVIFGNSCPENFCKRRVLKKGVSIKECVWLWHSCFPVDFVKPLWTPFYIFFYLLYFYLVFESSRKIYIFNSRQIFVRGIDPPTTLPIHKSK